MNKLSPESENDEFFDDQILFQYEMHQVNFPSYNLSLLEILQSSMSYQNAECFRCIFNKRQLNRRS